MWKRYANIALMIVGLFLAVVSTREILHHRYDYFAPGEEGGWTSNFAYLLMGVFLFLVGVVGLVSAKRGQPSD